jgi:cytidylate kinase
MNVRDVSLSLAEALLRSDSAPRAGQGELRSPLTVTISREVGALGTTVATEVGKQLGWPVYDQEIINKIADEMGKSLSQVRGLDERHVSWLEEALAGLSTDTPVSPTSYLKHLIATFHGLAVKGRCIIVGRGANYILPPRTTLSVRLVGDLQDRIKAVGQRRGISDREATRWMEQTENHRVGFIRDSFGKDSADPHHYDLVLNTSRLSVAECAESIVHALHLIERRAQPAQERTRTASALGGGSM